MREDLHVHICTYDFLSNQNPVDCTHKFCSVLRTFRLTFCMSCFELPWSVQHLSAQDKSKFCLLLSRLLVQYLWKKKASRREKGNLNQCPNPGSETRLQIKMHHVPVTSPLTEEARPRSARRKTIQRYLVGRYTLDTNFIWFRRVCPRQPFHYQIP